MDGSCRGGLKEGVFMNALKNLVADEKGLETVEYAIITGLVVAGTITAIAAIGSYVKTQFENLKTNLAA